MAFWLIQHNVQAYRQHPNLIGSEYPKKIAKLKKGDKIVYYATGDMVVIGTFEIVSDLFELKNDKAWGNIWVMKIKKRQLSKEPFIPIQNILKEEKISLFPKGKIKGIQLKGRTAIQISSKDFSSIERYTKKPRMTALLFHEHINDEKLGEPAELKVIRFTPTNEMGVVVLFTSFMRDLGFDGFEFIRAGFPDACVFEKTETGRHRQYVEFEFRASDFRIHVKNPKHNRIRCDYVICWENDYPLCPVKVIELKKELLRRGVYKESY